VRTLPDGWLGKNHALHHGAQRATGDWILFTDADIHFRPDALRRAIAHAEARHLDHLAAVPQLHERGHLLGICIGAFSLTFALFLRPWQIPNPRSPAHGGVGAFNLVRASAYRARGGHAPLRLRPDDDIKLGKLMKSAGGHSEFALGAGLISVAWYANTGELIRGLTKNAFAGVDYRAWMILGGVAAHALFFLWPILALGLTDGLARAAYAAAVGLMLLAAIDNQRFDGGRLWHGLLFPLGLVVLDYILLRSMIVTLWQRGITWRGTHYPLDALRRNRL
ncbi:MAG TPA: glycosyltransferase, partial [Acidobacteriota bacterium]|nr:glycosyltransferase [Acidobacteriota bacterium]